MLKTVYGLASSVTEFYKDLNPATLSGAIDVIVVERADGSFACSPFHVRFGKLSLLRPQEKVVEINVNGEVVSGVSMKVGEAGEAFFVVESENPIPTELQTSPLSHPTMQQPGDSLIPPRIDTLTLPAAAVKLEIMTASPSIEFDQDGFHSPQVAAESDGEAVTTSTMRPMTLTADDSQPSWAKFQYPLSDTEVELHGNSLIPDITLPQRPMSDTETDISYRKQAIDAASWNWQWGVMPSKSSPSIVQLKHNVVDTNHDDESLPEDGIADTGIGETEVQTAVEKVLGDSRKSVEDVDAQMRELNPRLLAKNMERDRDADVSNRLAESEAISSTSRSPSKGSSEEPSKELAEESPPRRRFVQLNDVEHNDDKMLSQENVQSDSELPKTKSKVDEDDKVVASETATKEPLKSPDDLKAKAADVSVVDKEKIVKFTSIAQLEDIELSLCGVQLTISDAEEKFNKSRVSFDDFCLNVSIMQSPNLIARVGNEYYSWSRLSLHMTSLLVFRQPLPEALVKKAAESLPESATSAKPEENRKTTSYSGWRNWWSRGTSATRAATVIEAEATKIVAEIKVVEKPSTAPAAVSIASPIASPKQFLKSLRLTSEQLHELNLEYGPNSISFTVNTSFQGKATCHARIFLWRYDIKLVVSDIDGTITKSDALGHIFNMVGKDWTHPGIANLYTKIKQNGYEIMYLTSRAIGQADSTRGYLKGIEQGPYVLPDGPVIMSPDRLITALKREVIDRRPEQFKIACLKDIRSLFGDRNSFYAGFGNRVTDAISYRAVDIPAFRIYSINSNGEVSMDYFSGYTSSYIKLTDLVDQIFPPLRPRLLQSQSSMSSLKGLPGSQPQSRESSMADIRLDSSFGAGLKTPGLDVVEEEFNDYNYWRDAPGYLDLNTNTIHAEPPPDARVLMNSTGESRMAKLRNENRQRRQLVTQSWDGRMGVQGGAVEPRGRIRLRPHSASVSGDITHANLDENQQEQLLDDDTYEYFDDGDDEESEGGELTDTEQWSEEMETVGAYPYI